MCLKQQQYEVEHFAFPSPAKKHISDIRQYINAASIPIHNSARKRFEGEEHRQRRKIS